MPDTFQWVTTIVGVVAKPSPWLCYRIHLAPDFASSPTGARGLVRRHSTNPSVPLPQSGLEPLIRSPSFTDWSPRAECVDVRVMGSMYVYHSMCVFPSHVRTVPNVLTSGRHSDNPGASPHRALSSYLRASDEGRKHGCGPCYVCISNALCSGSGLPQGFIRGTVAAGQINFLFYRVPENRSFSVFDESSPVPLL